jgi:hypothetical protein
MERAFGAVLTQGGRGKGFMKNLTEQRVCSSTAAGMSTARKLLAGRTVVEQTHEKPLELALQTDAERAALESLVAAL